MKRGAWEEVEDGSCDDAVVLVVYEDHVVLVVEVHDVVESCSGERVVVDDTVLDVESDAVVDVCGLEFLDVWF